MRRQPGTRALVLHFPASALKFLVKKGYIYQFPSCLSSESSRYEERFCRIRFYAGQIWQALECGGTYAQLSAKANLELLLVTLFTEFGPQQLNLIPEEDKRRATMRLLLTYVEEHYAEKLALEDLRTTPSTTGLMFLPYLSRWWESISMNISQGCASSMP